jgi:hypothetical protein
MHTQISSRWCVLQCSWPTWKSNLLEHMFVCVIYLGNKLKFQAKPWGIVDLQPLIVWQRVFFLYLSVVSLSVKQIWYWRWSVVLYLGSLLVDNSNWVNFVRFYNHVIVRCKFLFDGPDGVVFFLSTVCVAYTCISIVLLFIQVLYVFCYPHDTR